MPIVPMQNSLLQTLLSNAYAFVVLKGVVLLILIFYAIFALIIIRQVDLMSKTILTPLAKIVKFISIVHFGFVIALIVLAWGIL